jgi:hypothetical protein
MTILFYKFSSKTSLFKSYLHILPRWTYGTHRQTDRSFGEGYFYVQLTHMNGFRAKNNFSEGVEKCIARGIRYYAAICLKNT